MHPSDIGDFRSSLVVHGTVSNNRRSCVVGVVVRVRLVSRRRSPSLGAHFTFRQFNVFSEENALTIFLLKQKNTTLPLEK